MPNRKRWLLHLLAATALMAEAEPVHAQARQATGSIGASVTIPYPVLTGSGVRPLQFGVVIPSAGPVTTLPSYVSGTLSGEWRLTGSANQKSIDITFTLPSVLTASGGRSMPISFNGNYAALCEISDATQTCQTGSFITWNPVTTATFHDTPQRWKPGRPKYEFNYYSVYIGGQVQPSSTQPGGTYTGTVGIVLVIN
jgi:hypothetical protein